MYIYIYICIYIYISIYIYIQIHLCSYIRRFLHIFHKKQRCPRASEPSRASGPSRGRPAKEKARSFALLQVPSSLSLGLIGLLGFEGFRVVGFGV